MKSPLIVAVAAVAGMAGSAFAQAVLPGYLTDPSAMREAVVKDSGYQTPERLKYPYVSTYYVKPTVTPDEVVKVGFFVTDFESSKIRFLDDSHRFTAYLEYRRKADRPECDPYQGGRAQTPAAPQQSKVLTLKNLKSGDGEFKLGKLPVGEYEMRIWVVDAKGRESHRVIHDFRVMEAADLRIPADKVYQMTAADLTAYGIRNDGDLEKIVIVDTNGVSKVVKEKRAGVPGYTVTVPLDPKTGKVPFQAYKKVTVEYDAGYDKAAVEAAAVATGAGIQKLLDEKAAAGFRKVVLLPGVYRISHEKPILVPDRMTLDLGGATLKENAFTGASALMVNITSGTDSHLVGGTLEGDYWTHDYKGSPNNSEWCSGFQIGGDSWYSSVENVKVVDITGYGGQNGIAKDAKGWLSFFYENLPKFTSGGLDPKTGEIDASDAFRFTTDFADLRKITGEKGRRRLQISKHLGYQGRLTRSWQMTVCWYDAEKKFISSETCWQYREMWIPPTAAFLRVSIEEESVEAANKTELRLTAFRLPVNCAVKGCTFDHCRCVGYAASAMKNFLFDGNFFTHSGESAAKCAFDAEDGWDQMQDVYFIRNVFRENPVNNSILTCAGHNFILEKNDCDVYFWGRTHSPCVRGNAIGSATYRCDSRLRSGYGRFDDNTYAKGVNLGLNEGKGPSDGWDYVLSGLAFDDGKGAFNIEVGRAGRMVNCTFRNLPVSVANAFACTFENCTDGSTYRSVPGGRWLDVTVKGCSFNRFYQTNAWERCHVTGSKLNGFAFGGLFAAKGCDFTDTSFFGFDTAVLRMTGCTFKGTTLGGNYWQKPADFIFRDCTIGTKDDAAFLKLGVYTIGKIGFDGCTVTGGQPLVDVKDLRRIQLPPNAKAGVNPDDRPGTIALRGMKWASGAKTVVVQEKNRNPSPKKIQILDKGNAWPDGVSVAKDIPPAWELRKILHL